MATSNIPKIAITDDGYVEFLYSDKFRYERAPSVYTPNNGNISINQNINYNTVSELIYYDVNGNNPSINSDNYVGFQAVPGYWSYNINKIHETEIKLIDNQIIKYLGYLDKITSDIITVKHHNDYSNKILAEVKTQYNNTQLTIKKEFGYGSIYYTIDNSDPKINGIFGGNTVIINNANEVIVKCCVKYGSKTSEILTYNYGNISANITELTSPIVEDVNRYLDPAKNYYVNKIRCYNKNIKENNTIGYIYYTTDGSDPDINSNKLEYDFDYDYTSAVIEGYWDDVTLKIRIIYINNDNTIYSDIITKTIGDGIIKTLNAPQIVANETTGTFKVISDTEYGRLELIQGTELNSLKLNIDYNQELSLNVNYSPNLKVIARYANQTQEKTYNFTNNKILEKPTIIVKFDKIVLNTSQSVNIYYKFEGSTTIGSNVYKKYVDSISIPEGNKITIYTYCSNSFYVSEEINQIIIDKEPETEPETEQPSKIELYGSENAELTNNHTKPYLDIIYNEYYDIPKCLNSIDYILNKIDSNIKLDMSSEELFNNDYSGDYLIIFTNETYSDLLSLKQDNSSINGIENFKIPYKNKGIWNFNYFRNNINTAVTDNELNSYVSVPYYNTETRITEYKTININKLKTLYKNNNNYEKSDLRSLIYGKYFITRFIFEPTKANSIKFETISFNINKY